MATAAALITDVRSRIVEATASYFTDAEILRWLNYGYKNFMAKTEWASKIKAYNVVANQFRYAIPSDCIKIEDVRWQDKYKVWPKDREEFAACVGPAVTSTGTRPFIYESYPWDSSFRIHPVPSAASASTTLNGGINSSVTTITLTSATSFPSAGKAIIESEQIQWYAKSGNDLQQVVRGDGATTAASHLTGVTISYAPLEVYMTYQPTELATSPQVDTVTSANYDEAFINYACHVAMIKREKYDQAGMFLQLYEKILQTAVEERRRQQRDRLFSIKDEDTLGQLEY